jgi:sarcosine oxidase subunit gamma
MILKDSASMLDHHAPLEPHAQSRGDCLADGPGLRVDIVRAGFLLLQSPAQSSVHDALVSEIGLGLPAPREASLRDDFALLWLTPAEWLLELPTKQADALQVALTHRLATALAVVTDMTDAFLCCEVTGARAAETLMSGCSLDLRPDAFPAGRVARTGLADVPAIIWTPGTPDRFRCLVDRGFAGHVRDWLQDVGRPTVRE